MKNLGKEIYKHIAVLFLVKLLFKLSNFGINLVFVARVNNIAIEINYHLDNMKEIFYFRIQDKLFDFSFFTFYNIEEVFLILCFSL